MAAEKNIVTVCVCGAGTMGCGIAQVAAAAGLTTILYEPNEDVLQKAAGKIQSDLQKRVDKQKLAPTEKERIFKRIQFTAHMGQCVADVIIEAIIEKAEAKVSLLHQLTAINAASVIMATNTSSLSITEMAQLLPNPERIIGLHFFNPAPLMKLVEVVQTQYTHSSITQAMVALARQMGKTPVVCSDAPGFIVNRVARPYYLEGLRLAEEGFAFETIDKLLEDRGFKMGPFRLMDLIGNDINYAVSCSVYEQLHRPDRLTPSALQREKVENSELGKKTGKGFYTY